MPLVSIRGIHIHYPWSASPLPVKGARRAAAEEKSLRCGRRRVGQHPTRMLSKPAAIAAFAVPVASGLALAFSVQRPASSVQQAPRCTNTDERGVCTRRKHDARRTKMQMLMHGIAAGQLARRKGPREPPFHYAAQIIIALSIIARTVRHHRAAEAEVEPSRSDPWTLSLPLPRRHGPTGFWAATDPLGGGGGSRKGRLTARLCLVSSKAAATICDGRLMGWMERRAASQSAMAMRP